MESESSISLGRRQFLCGAMGAAVASVAIPGKVWAGSSRPSLMAGEGRADITPPLGIELAGFHKAPGKERRISAIRQPSQVRALALSLGDTEVAICSLDVIAVDAAITARIQKSASAQTGIPPENIRVATTHTHSMPSFCRYRQWGAVPAEFMAAVERRTVEAICAARADRAPAELLLGKSAVPGGSHNRTVKRDAAKTDQQFGPDSTDAERWLDTLLQAMVFRRQGKPDLVWYNFSAHAVCYADDQAGPDWPGEVAQGLCEQNGEDPSFLQGHCGDVNPGDGSNWRGEIRQTVAAITPALQKALAAATSRQVDCLRTKSVGCELPLDLELFRGWLDEYRRDPEKCNRGRWVDAGFAAEWFQANQARQAIPSRLPITLSAIQVGPVGLVFHPAELYTYYGLAIRRASPLADTLVVGYADGMIGYLPDPGAYTAGEYSAITVPKILDNPPFAPTAARDMTAAAIGILKRTVS
jgi:neutral ceramidase